MEIAEVVDRESLEAYLNGLPDESNMTTAQFVAFRSGARVAPIAFRFFAENGFADDHAARVLPIWASIAVQNVVLSAPARSLSGVAISHAAKAIDYHADYAGAHSTDMVADATLAVSNGSFSSAAVVEAADYFKGTVINSVTHGVYYAANAFAQMTPKARVDFWSFVRDDLQHGRAAQDKPLWLDAGMPVALEAEWHAACSACDADKSGADWTFWTTWYDRILTGKDIHADRLAPIFNEITEEHWVVDPARVNARFEEVLAIYQAEYVVLDGAGTASNPQITDLQIYVDTEYRTLNGRVHRDPAEVEILELLEDMKVFVDYMLGRIETSTDAEQASTLAHEIWSVVVKKAKKLAIVEPDHRMSSAILGMAESAGVLADAGVDADPRRTTRTELAGPAIQKQATGWRRFFPFMKQASDRS